MEVVVAERLPHPVEPGEDVLVGGHAVQHEVRAQPVAGEPAGVGRFLALRPAEPLGDDSEQLGRPGVDLGYELQPQRERPVRTLDDGATGRRSECREDAGFVGTGLTPPVVRMRRVWRRRPARVRRLTGPKQLEYRPIRARRHLPDPSRGIGRRLAVLPHRDRRRRAEDELELLGRDLGQTRASTVRSCTSAARRVSAPGSVCGRTP